MRGKLGALLVGACALLGLLAAPAVAQDIPAGVDVWNTPGGGGTFFTMSQADLFTLCSQSGLPTDPTWNGGDQVIVLQGQDLPNLGNADIVIARLDDALFSASRDGTVTVRIQVQDLSFVSVSAIDTPCGPVDFVVTLQDVVQPITTMTIHRTSAAGGTFDAVIEMDVQFEGRVAGTTQTVGFLTYFARLNDVPGGSPWSYTAPQGALDPAAPWFPGVLSDGTRVEITRHYDGTIPASHMYKPPRKKCTSTTPDSSTTEGLTAQPAEPCPVPTEPTTTL